MPRVPLFGDSVPAEQYREPVGMKLSATSDTDPRAVPLEMTDPAASMAVHELWKHLDGDTRGHLVKVGQLAYDLARHIGLTAEERADSGLAGLLNDIGKLWIPHKVVAKADLVEGLIDLERRRLGARAA